jgi:hypothetical protein
MATRTAMPACLLLAVAAAVLAACAGGPKEGPATPPVAETRLLAATVHLPLTGDGIPTTINGHGPFHVGLDTGQSTPLLISPTLAQEIGLPVVAQGSAGDGSGVNAVPVEVVRVESISIGDAHFRDVEGIVLDRIGGDRPKDGRFATLGFPLFSGCLFVMDPVGGLRLEQGALPKPDGRSVLPMTIDRGLARIEVTVGSRSTPAVIDSAWGGVLALPLAFADDLPLVAPPVIVGRVATLFNEVDLLTARLDGSVWIGTLRLDRPVLQFSDLFDDQVILGSDCLERFVITFDQANGRVRFEPR